MSSIHVNGVEYVPAREIENRIYEETQALIARNGELVAELLTERSTTREMQHEISAILRQIRNQLKQGNGG